MSESLIKVENLSKQYRLGVVGTGTLSHDLNRWWKKAMGKEDPYLKIGEVNDRSQKSSSDYVWALKDVNFEVKQGEVLGIIGRNGAGKSTLLKILSQITQPTSGEIRLKGKVASLLEVGTGFHPELSGRENIFLNGAILGMRKAEIQKKFDEIVDFSGVEKFIDTPVKRYSSGMYVRLAFAVAAHLEPEILIVDEVLAVGDAEFQKKCLGKMKDVSGQGRTVLFVSHNLHAVSNLCTKGVLLIDGKISINGSIEECIKKYIVSSRVSNLAEASLKDRLSRTTGDVLFTQAKAMKDGKECWEFNHDEEINFEFKALVQRDTEGLSFYFALKHPFTGENITNIHANISQGKIVKGKHYVFSISIPKKVIRTGQYSLYFCLADIPAKVFYDVVDANVNLPMLEINPASIDYHENMGFITMPYNLKIHD